MAKVKTKLERWLKQISEKDEKVKPYYIWRAVYFPYDTPIFELVHFNLTKERADYLFSLVNGNHFDGDVCEHFEISNALQDMSFFEQHPGYSIDVRFIQSYH